MSQKSKSLIKKVSNTKRKRNDDESNDDLPKKLSTSTLQAAKKTFWGIGLIESMQNPELVVKEDDLTIVIKDKYPKSQYHYLVLSKKNLPSLRHVKTEDLKLLQHMHGVGENLVSQHKDCNFKLGYHAEMSMQRLHLHVISDDMVSTSMKHKKHWNSFNTKFFMPSLDICNMLKNNGKIEFLSKIECEKLLKSDLKCHKCSYVPKNFPDLQKHLKQSHFVI